MTFLDLRYRLRRPLGPKDLERMNRLYTVYGIRGFSVHDQELVVEYDASRIHEAEVLVAIRQVGITAQPEETIPLGGFDHTGEFRDCAWPTRGLNPVNQKMK